VNEENTSKTNIPQLARELLHLPFAQVVPSDTNPRLNLDKEPFEELKKSIFANGLLQPIVVRPKDSAYEIIGGHRRYFALKQLAEENPADKRFTRIAVVVVHVSDALVPVMQLAENLNRADLSCVEVADGVARAVRSGTDPTQLADSLGWSRRQIKRYTQLADAPQWLRDCAREVKVSRRKTGPDGTVVIDPKTSKAAVETERYPGLGFSLLIELHDLYEVLRKVDAIELDEVGGESFKPQAERVTKRLTMLCAANEWSRRRLIDEIKRVKDPKPRPDVETAAKPPLAVTAERCIVDLRRAALLAPADRAALAADITKALAPCRFKSISITP
jgi:ParB/RepB/Spo0J family partition protein